MSFLVTKAGSSWSVVETTTGGIGGFFVTLDAAMRFVVSMATPKGAPLRVTVR
jgi:hypothetical protein